MKNELSNEKTKISNKLFYKVDDFYKTINPDSKSRNKFCINFLFEDCTFININFNNWNFVECSFDRVIFENCNLDGIEFFQSALINCRILQCSLRRGSTLVIEKFRNSRQATFINSKIERSLIHSCDITEGYIKNCELRGVEFQNCTMHGCYLTDCKFTFISINKCNLNSAKLEGYNFTLCDFNNCDVNEKTLFEFVGPKYSKEEAFLLYNQIFKLFKNQGLDELAEKHFFIAKKFESMSSNKIAQKIWLFVLKYSCGYGERPERVVITSFCIIFVFALLHMINGLSYPDLELLSRSDHFIKCLYFSAVTFTTLGDGDVARLNKLGMLLIVLESSLGILFTAIGTAAFYKKITK